MPISDEQPSAAPRTGPEVAPEPAAAGSGGNAESVRPLRWRGWRYVAPAVAGLLASVLLLGGLADKYLWQDEALTAVLATRMLRFGKPLAYDGVNLITFDDFRVEDQTTIGQRTANPRATIEYYADRGYFRPDTTWTFHPWGQFVVAAASLKLLGQNTLAARLPFALAGVGTVLLLYEWVAAIFVSPLMAQLAVALLILNSYWILHARQCRYYALSSLFLLLTLAAYTRWQRGGRWGAAAFVIAAWCWFQMDYGTVWPVLGVLFVDAFVADRRRLLRPFLAGTALAAALAPFVVFYRLWGRAKQDGNWGAYFQGNLFNINEYVAPGLLVLAAMVLLAWRWKKLAAMERRLIAVACAIIGALLFWVPTAAQSSFLRYSIMAAPIGCLLGAWVLARGFRLPAVYAWMGAVVLMVTPWVSLPLHVVNHAPAWYPGGRFVRGELSALWTEVFGYRPDPNRMVIEWLQQHVTPTDEILTNYEDYPMMFYLRNPIRGGVSAFRAEDDAVKPPDYLVLRQSVTFVHWPVFEREVKRYRWAQDDVPAPDVPWGNFPDPIGQSLNFFTEKNIIVAHRISGEAAH